MQRVVSCFSSPFVCVPWFSGHCFWDTVYVRTVQLGTSHLSVCAMTNNFVSHVSQSASKSVNPPFLLPSFLPFLLEGEFSFLYFPPSLLLFNILITMNFWNLDHLAMLTSIRLGVRTPPGPLPRLPGLFVGGRLGGDAQQEGHETNKMFFLETWHPQSTSVVFSPFIW